MTSKNIKQMGKLAIVEAHELPEVLSEWQYLAKENGNDRETSHLYRHYQFKDFESAIRFMTIASANFIRSQNHHPRWQNSYSLLEIWLTTHEAGSRVTERDVLSAKSFEALWQREFSE